MLGDGLYAELEKLNRKMDSLLGELSVTNTLLLYIFQAQLKQLNMDGFQQLAALESLMKDNPAVKRHLKK